MYILKKIIAILFGSILLSVGINFFLMPYELLDGGVIGLGLIINYLIDIQAGFVILALSIPIFVLAWFYNKKYFFNSLHGMLLSSLMIDFLAPSSDRFMFLNQNPLISSLLGGVLVGSGIGIMLRYETSTGGTDLLAQFLSEHINLNVGIIILIIDVFIIYIGAILLSGEHILFSIITIIVVGIITTIFTWNRYKSVH